MAATDATPVPMKGVAYRATFPIYDADGDLVTSAAGLDSEVDKDAAGYNDCTNEATEIGSSGTYYLDLTATEMNADTVSVLVKTSTSGAKTTVLVLYPEEAGNIRATALLSVGTGAGQLNVASGKAPVTLAAGDVTGNVAADVVNWKGSAAPNMSGDAYARLGAPAGASVSADVAAVKAETALIVADTNELQTDWANGGRLDLLLDAANNGSPPAASAIADAVLDEMLSGHTTTGTVGKKLGDLANADLSGVATSTVAAAIQLVTDRLAAMLEDAGTYDRFLATALEEAPTGGAGTAPTVQQIDAQLTASHGAGAWGGAVGSGANTVTVTLTCSSVPVPGAYITVKNSGQTATLAGPVKTDANGQAVVNLDDGSYKVLVGTTPAYQPLAAATLTVSGTTPLALALTATTIAAPADPSLCRVYAWLRLNEAPVVGDTLEFRATSNAGEDGILLSNLPVIATSDALGYAYADLVQGAGYTVISRHYRLAGKAITIPAASTADLEGLL